MEQNILDMEMKIARVEKKLTDRDEQIRNLERNEEEKSTKS